MAVNGFTNIVTDGLVLSLDAGNLKSYPTSGTTWTDLTRSGNNGVLNNFGGQFFTSNNSGGIVFDGIDSYTSVNNLIRTGLGFNGTIEVVTSCNGAIVNNERTTNNVGNGYFYINSNRIYVGVNSYNQPPYSYGSTSVISGNSNSINYYAASYQIPLTNGTMSGVFCINGVFENFSNSLLVITSQIDNTLTNVDIGRDRNFTYGTGYCTSGTTSIVRIYNRPLSNSEILQNYNATKWRFI